MSQFMVRQAKKSDEYVSEILAAQKKMGGRSLTAKEKQHRLSLILSDQASGLKRLGASMIGPIQLKLRYQGISRNVLVEDTLTPGVPVEYEILDDLGQAYILHGNEGEVKITPFEGKRAPVQLFRIATFPTIKKEDLSYMKVNMVEYVQDESKQSIMKQEDGRLVKLLDAAVTDYSTKDPNGNSHIITAPAGYLTPNVFYDAITISDQLEVEGGRVLMNIADYRDLYRWDNNVMGWQMRNDVVAGQKITTFGEFQIGRSVMIPKKTTYVTAAPEFTGVMPVMYSLDVVENHKPETFSYGWTMDELIGMAILNPRGIVKIVKP